MMPTNMSESLLAKKVRSPGPKPPKTQCLVTHMCCNTNVYILKATKGQVAECVKLLAQRMKEAKEKQQEQSAERWRLSLLRTSKSSQKQVSKSNNDQTLK